MLPLFQIRNSVPTYEYLYLINVPRFSKTLPYVERSIFHNGLQCFGVVTYYCILTNGKKMIASLFIYAVHKSYTGLYIYT